MSGDSVLTLLRLPARLHVGQVAELLGFAEHDIQILMRVGLLKALGKPAANAPKYFATKTVQELAADDGWLNKATNAVSHYWKAKNQRRALCATP